MVPEHFRAALHVTQNELILYCGLTWAGAVAVMIALDYLGNNWPKRRFRPRGWLVPRQLMQRRAFRRKVRAVKDEQVRETLEHNLGTPTLAVSKKRRQAAIDRSPLLSLPGLPDSDGDQSANGRSSNTDDPVAALPPADVVTAEEAWQHLEAAGWDLQNRQRLERGEPPVRWNPIRRAEETAVLSTVGDTIVLTWPNPPDEPFAGADA